MASDIFMKIGTYKGESADKAHKESIDVLSWSWGVNQSGSMGHGGGGGSGYRGIVLQQGRRAYL